ncbi:glycosyltransferase 87 family protein [Nocardia yamanashiensis]|uniref:glycosyltransferase 87 family protein n=1 Tax=Nocardia yamanashiensis TaxID=209247 RepID=UPI001E3BB8BA|nr:glycosyltransferase 87 family protein [Nocardia yamanashiensis]UGT39933.1 glycosyltransferase 87 family protein [Nocardia yamanashiensis]
MSDRSGLADPAEPVTAPEGRPRLTRQQAILLVIAAAMFAVSAKFCSDNAWKGYIDLQVYRNGGRALLDGKDLYGPMPEVFGIGLPFTYPPPAAFFFAPLALMSLHVAEWVVLISSIIALALTLWVVLSQLRPTMTAATRLAVVVGATALAQGLEPVWQTYGFGQINLILMAAITLDCLVRKPFWPRGMLIGIAVSVKLTPAAYLLYFLAQQDWRPALAKARASGPVLSARGALARLRTVPAPAYTMVASCLGAILVGFAVVPHDSVTYWFGTLFDTSRIGQPEFAGNQSLKGFAFRLGVSDTLANAIWLGLSILTVVLAVIWMRRLFSVGARAAALMVNAGMVLLISPVSWSHHWVWTAPALLIAADAILRGRRDPLFLSAFALAIVAFTMQPQWLLPYDHGIELTWSWWEKIIGSAYPLLTLAIFIGAVLTYRPVPTSGVKKAASAAA